MAALTTNLPSRLRQLLSRESAIGPSLKLDDEPPERTKDFIDRILKCPLQDIAAPLSEFKWKYNKGNFYHWRPLLLHFDLYFKTYVSNRNDLMLADNILEDTSEFPKQDVIQILRVLKIIFENCHNKASYDGLEHFKLLLASTDPEIVTAALETLSALVRINPSKLHSSGKLIACGSINGCLLSLAQGWGSKEEGLGLHSCVTTIDKTRNHDLPSPPPPELPNNVDKSQPRLGSTVYFEIHSDSGSSSSSVLIHLPDLHLREENDLTLMKQCMYGCSVPQEHRFSLLTRIRYAHAFCSPTLGRSYIRICLLAFIVLVQSNDAHDELISFFANEPEYSNELIRIVRSEDTVNGVVRTLAMLALGAQLAAYSSSHERARILSGSSINFAGGNRMILLNVLQRAVLYLNSSSDPSSVSFVEAILQFYLLHVISSSSSASVVRGSGMVPTFLPLLEDSNSSHVHLVCCAVKTLQKLMDYSNTSVTLFKDLGGVDLLAHRLQVQVNMVISSTEVVFGEDEDDRVHTQKRLIKVLLKALGSATYSPANSTRIQNPHDTSMPTTLSLIFTNVDKFGGDIYFSAVTVMSEIIHKDPTCFSILHEAGLADAFLSSVVAGVIPSSKALTCIPNGLGAICLNTKGLESVKETSVLRFLVDIFTTKKYVSALNDGIVPLANAFEELLRHASSLRGAGVDIIIEIIGKIASFRGDDEGKGSEIMVMETDSEEKEKEKDSDSKNISEEQFTQLCVFHVMVLVHRTMENSETCRLFVEKSGIEALLKLLLRPHVAQSSEGMSIALHSTMVFKGFTQHHSAPLAHAFCSALRGQLNNALSCFQTDSKSFLLDPTQTPNNTLFSSLFLVEFLLFLAASKDNRWVTSLLAEFGNGSKDVLESIGHVHREVLWQIAILDDSKLEKDGADERPQKSEISPGETSDQRFDSFRQLIDPLLRTRMSGWNVESQFFDLLNLYRDIGRATTSFQRRLRINTSPGLRSMATTTDHVQNPGLDSTAPMDDATKETEKQRSYHSSCCDMVKSLSFHIIHLFQELGKVMISPSRRREDLANISPSSKSVASTFALLASAHMSYAGHETSPGCEIPVSIKCRYFGKVIDFIDGILLDRPDSCNPILLNCLYGHGVVHLILTTFEATSQLLFAVNRGPPSPMDTDDSHSKQGSLERTDSSWIDIPLACYAKLLDHLVTSSFILSPSAKHYLTQSLVDGEFPFPRDGEAFVKVLQSMVLKAVLPVWAHTHFTDCSYDFISMVISIIRHVYSGVEVKTVTNTGSAISAQPPNETSISTIVEMGFSRARAEEALRQVGANCVEFAMEWLFSHPAEVQEDDELARALAMSLGSAGSEPKEELPGDNVKPNPPPPPSEEMIQAPPVNELLSTCVKLLQMNEKLAFPVRDLLVMICSQNSGKERSSVVSFIVDQVKHCGFTTDIGKDVRISTLLHVLALILHEDAEARQVAFDNGFVKIASDLLSQWDSSSWSEVNPRWVTAAFLAVDRMLQVNQSLSAEIVQQLKEEDGGRKSTPLTIDEGMEKCEKSPPTSHSSVSKNLDIHDQKRLVDIACHCLGHQLPSETVHSVLQLCSTLTRNHTVALGFLHGGGLPLLLSLPLGSLFPGFDNVTATIIRHILEDPQTLQQAMESEIRHSLMSAANRNPNGRLTPRNFISVLGSVISRDPVIFMQAARAVTEVEMVGDRSYIVLLKDSEKDKKEKPKAGGKDSKLQITEGKPSSNTPPPAGGKLQDLNTKGVKAHRKSPQSFISVIELLLDFLMASVPYVTEEGMPNVASEGPSPADMDIDLTVSRGKGKAVVTSPENTCENNQDGSASVAKSTFVLKLLTEILLMYGSSVHVLIRRDAEVAASRTYRGHILPCNGGIFSQTLHRFIPHSRNQRKEKKVDGDWKNKLSSRASQFLVAACVRSTEARRRILFDVSAIFEDFASSSLGLRAPGNDVHAHIELVNDILAARSPSGSSISAEASAAFIDVGLVRSLTRTLQVLDLDHPDTPKFVTKLIKALELVTREHVHSADTNAGKQENTAKYDQNRPGRGYIDGDIPQPMETLSHLTHGSVPAALRSFSNAHTHESSEGVTDDMEHDQDFEGGFGHDTEDDYMREGSEEGRGMENSMNTVGIRFEIQQHVQESLGDDDDDEMSGDDVEEDDDDDEEHNGLEEDEVHHMSHPDTDPDDHEIDDDGFVEEMLGDEEEEDEEEEEDDDEDGVILRLDEGVNGIDVLDHIEVFGRENSLPNETLHVMPVEVFGSRRQGRTTSIYSLLGRTGDSAEPSQHPLLVEPSSHNPTSRPNDNGRDTTLIDRSIETPISRLETIFHSLSEGRNGHRFSLWVDENQQGSITPVVPQGLEELLVSQLRRPVPDKPSEPNTQIEDPQNKEKTSQLDNLNTSEALPENIITNGSHPVISPSFAAVGGTENADIRPENGGNESNQALETSSVYSQSVEMQFEQADGMVRDIEAVSQESSGSGATLGESLRSLDVEIGSTDGHDEGGERQGPSGDAAVVRPRRMNVPSGTSPLGGRDISLHSVSEVLENPNGEADQGVVATGEQQNDGRGDSGRIDPAFLDALPEEMRAEVLSAQQGQPPQPTTVEPQNAEDIDPEFLAALPPDIRAEVLAQQHTQRLHQSQELEGQPVEMDTVSIIATFPSELREEVLLTSSDAILANLTPALVAEANMLRERFAHRYYNRTLFGTHRRTRRGEGSRRGEGMRSNMERVGGSNASRRSIAGKPVEASGNPLVDCEALSAMIRLLRVVQPLYKGQLQKLLLHLCAHSETRISLVKILIEMLMLDTRKQGKKSNIGESSFRLYACQSNVTYSRPQFSDGVPPLVSRRILETMTFLARNHPSVAKSLLYYRFNQKTVQEQENVDEREKGAMVCEDEMKEQPEGCAAIALLLSLLNQPLYLRSIAHLEQLLNLMEVVIDNADLKSTPSDTVAPATEQPSGDEAIPLETTTNSADPGETEPSNDAAKPVEAEEGSSEPPISVVEGDSDSLTVLQNLPSVDLQLLCSFLAREGLSDNAYSLVAEVLKKLVAISPSHGELFITELAKSVRSLSESAAEELHLFREADRALLIASSSIDGAAVLRVLQSLSTLVRSLTEHEKNNNTFSLVLSQIHSINSALEPLWQELSSCISKIESYSEVAIASISKPAGSVIPPLPAGTQNILPYIESFFVTCEKLNPGQLTGEEEARVSPSGQQRAGEGVGFVRFSEKHRKLLNAFIRQNTGLLEKSFSMMLKMPRLVDFDNKRAHFRSKIKQQHDHNHHNPLRISVRRNYILEDSYNQLRMRSAQDIKGRLTVHFQGEEGIDAGGLTREWYLLLSRVIFDKGALLFTTVGNHSTFQPNPNSVYQTEHLSYFKFIGRVVAKALFDAQLLDVHFTRSFYKHILGVKVTYHDIEAIDPDYFKNLKWMLENDVSDILDLTFSIDADEEKLILYERTEVTDYELIPGGRNVRVTEENKHKYVDLVAEHKLTTAIRPQINSFLEGFNELIPRGLISIFNDKEFELLISGLPDIDLDDLRANTEYSGYGASSQMVRWFWEVVQSISKEDRARLLQFVTGTSKVPLDGFSALQGISGSQKFQIHKAYGHPEHLPSAHTCFNQLDLPEYPSKEHLEDRLLLAIHEGNEGFGFG